MFEGNSLICFQNAKIHEQKKLQLKMLELILRYSIYVKYFIRRYCLLIKLVQLG
jgi:hypothetical protein